MVIVHITETQRKVISSNSGETVDKLFERFCKENEINRDMYEFRSVNNQSLDGSLVVNDFGIRELKLVKSEKPKAQPRTKKLSAEPAIQATSNGFESVGRRAGKRQAPKPPPQLPKATIQQLKSRQEPSPQLKPRKFSEPCRVESPEIDIPPPPETKPAPRTKFQLPFHKSVECTINEQELSSATNSMPESSSHFTTNSHSPDQSLSSTPEIPKPDSPVAVVRQPIPTQPKIKDKRESDEKKREFKKNEDDKRGKTIVIAVGKSTRSINDTKPISDTKPKKLTHSSDDSDVETIESRKKSYTTEVDLNQVTQEVQHDPITINTQPEPEIHTSVETDFEIKNEDLAEIQKEDFPIYKNKDNNDKEEEEPIETPQECIETFNKPEPYSDDQISIESTDNVELNKTIEPPTNQSEIPIKVEITPPIQTEIKQSSAQKSMPQKVFKSNDSRPSWEPVKLGASYIFKVPTSKPVSSNNAVTLSTPNPPTAATSKSTEIKPEEISVITNDESNFVASKPVPPKVQVKTEEKPVATSRFTFNQKKPKTLYFSATN